MDQVMREVKRALALGDSAIKKGMWELGLARYSYAAGLLRALHDLSQTGNLEPELTHQEEVFLAASVAHVEEAIESIRAEWGNGHHNPPNRGLAKAAAAMLDEVDRIG
jgi:hypothetical protein